MMEQGKHKGSLTLEKFSIQYEDIGEDTLQLDVTGQAPIRYQEMITNELIVEINANINAALHKYAKNTGHDASRIGYYFDLQLTKTYNREHHQAEVEISLTIVFKKPVKNATAYSLTPSIKLISSLILAEIFMMK